MDNRKSPRYSINLEALVHPSTGRSWLCTISDFCDGGMLLLEKSSRSRRRLGATAGEVVGIHFRVPRVGGDKRFRLEGMIVRVMDSGIGINFPDGMPEDALNALFEHAQVDQKAAGERQRRADQQATSADIFDENGPHEVAAAGATDMAIARADASKVIAALRREVVKIVPEMSSTFFSYMGNELLALARDAKSNAVQSDYFAAMSTLEKNKKPVSQTFLNEILDQIDNPRDLKKLLAEREETEAARKKEGNKKIKLSLVDTDDFEDWLAVANIISRAERGYEQQLNEIQLRMGMLVDSWAHKEANPLGVSVFCHSFDHAIRRLELGKDVRQKVYTGLETKIVPLLRKFYANVTKLLEESGVFPEIEEDFISPVAPTKAEAEEAEEPEPEEIEPEEEFDEEDYEEWDDQERPRRRRRSGSQRWREPSADREPSAGREPSGRRQSATNRRPEEAQADPEGAPRPGALESPSTSRRGEVGKALSSIYSTVRSLMNMSGGLTGAEFDEEFDSANVMELDEVQEMLRSIQPERTAPGQRIPVREQLQQRARAAGNDRRLPPRTLDRLSMVENLIDTIEHDSMLSGSAKDWMRQLELSLDKVATREGEEFLDMENPHEALEVVNHLAKLGDAESASVNRSVDQIIQKISENYDSDPNVFSEALDELKPLVDRQSRAFSGNVQRAVKASEGQQTLVNAQRAVIDEMDSRLAGREVPEILLKLLVPGWRNLLVNTHLRHGKDSEDWQNHVRALEQVFEHLDSSSDPRKSPDYMEPDELVDHIEQGLDSIAFEPGQRGPLIKSLKQMLTDEGARQDIPVVEMPADSVAETLGFENISEKDSLREEIRESQADNPEWSQWLSRVQNLYVGEWLQFEDGSDEGDIAIVAWISEDQSNLVFVNRRGVKTYGLSAEEVALRLMEGTAKILEESDIPLTDRASHRMLQNMHNQLTHQATHDELTGLINRKEFERELQRALGVAQRSHVNHLVAYMDLDQFKVINNASGHEAGDQLLKEISELLLSRLPDEKVTLSRLGGDEFGLLIEDCDREAAMSVVRQLCDAVRSFKFEWEGDSYTLATSCGVVYMTADTNNVSAVLTGADSACIAAKDEGRDRIHVYEAGDEEMERRRDIMEFVAQIDSALAEDRFVLNCQKISPIDQDSEDHVHYEILLTVLGEDGDPLPPQDFIVAAETYNRMGHIDRWVIKNAFKFIASNVLKLEGLDAFSINISGNSMREEGFMEFVLDQFHETRLPTSRICFEITETSAIGSLDDAIDFMERLKVIGVKFSLDDFGTGLSSYSYLRNLPVDYLKIDGIFVKDLKTSPTDYAVVKSINEIGHFMGKKTIAEFVEDDEILEMLREIGVDFAQGWGVEKKMPITELLN